MIEHQIKTERLLLLLKSSFEALLSMPLPSNPLPRDRLEFVHSFEHIFEAMVHRIVDLFHLVNLLLQSADAF